MQYLYNGAEGGPAGTEDEPYASGDSGATARHHRE